jgi:NADPH:quinone reductase
MRAVVVTRFGGREVLELRDEPEPDAGHDDLLVEPEAIGVNYRDISSASAVTAGRLR